MDGGHVGVDEGFGEGWAALRWCGVRASVENSRARLFFWRGRGGVGPRLGLGRVDQG